MFYAERFPNPTRASSPRQLPTDHVHAVPTREYQSDQSSRMLLRCYRPCCPKQNKLKAHQQERVRTGAPVECVPSARTVLTVKGSLRRAKQRRALDCCAPFRPTSFATGGSGGNTKPSAKNKPMDRIQHGSNGLLCEAEDAASLRAAIGLVVNMKQSERVKMGSSARDTAEQWPVVRMIDTISALAGTGQVPLGQHVTHSA